MSLVDQVTEYFVALITGVILLYVLWEIAKSLLQDVPELNLYFTAIVLAAAGALVLIARRGIE